MSVVKCIFTAIPCIATVIYCADISTKVSSSGTAVIALASRLACLRASALTRFAFLSSSSFRLSVASRSYFRARYPKRGAGGWSLLCHGDLSCWDALATRKLLRKLQKRNQHERCRIARSRATSLCLWCVLHVIQTPKEVPVYSTSQVGLETTKWDCSREARTPWKRYPQDSLVVCNFVRLMRIISLLSLCSCVPNTVV